MASNVLEKHKTWINDCLLQNLFKQQKLIVCKNPNQHIKIRSIDIKPMSMDNTFMLTFCYFVRISIEITRDHLLCEDCDNFSGEKEFDLLTKFSPEVDADTYVIFNMETNFQIEITVYEDIVPKVKCLSNSPKYYYSHNRCMDAVIVLSDFRKDGWQMSKSMVNLSLDHILAAVKHLGEFHGTMYALKLTDTATFVAMKNKLDMAKQNDSNAISPNWNLVLELSIKRATYNVRISSSKSTSNEVPESFLRRLEDVLFETHKYLGKRMEPIEPFAIICHGDYLRNNIAFRYDDDGMAIDAMMFDFQTMSYTSPMIDLCTFMAISTGYEVRDKYFWNIFATYHNALTSTFLAQSQWHANDIPEFLKYNSILVEYCRYMPFGLSCAASFLDCLYEPGGPLAEAMSVENIVKKVFKRDGKAQLINDELRSLIVDMYNLYTKFDLTLENL